MTCQIIIIYFILHKQFHSVYYLSFSIIFCSFNFPFAYLFIIIFFMKNKNKPSKLKQSYQSLRINFGQNSSNKIYPMESIVDISTIEQKKPKSLRKKVEADYFLDYKPANYRKAIKFMNQHSYKRKLITGEYQQIQLFENNQAVKQFGIGIYLYLELFKRCFFIFFFMSLIQAIPIYLNLQSTGFENVSLSYGTYLITTTLGNYNTQITSYDVYIFTGAHCAINLLFFLFFLNWKLHNYKEIEQFQENNNIVHPRKFAVQMEGFPKRDVTNKQLETFFSIFGQVYECSLVYNYKDKLKYFQQADNIDEQIKQCELSIKLDNGDLKQLQKLKKKKQELVEQINNIKISPSILSAYVHFQYEKSKIDLLDYYNNHYLFSNAGHKCIKCLCCCCLDKVQQDYLFRGTQELRVKSEKVTDPEQINWESLDVTNLGKFLRILFALLIVIIFLVICSSLVALCSIFISTNSINCQGINIPTITQIISTNDSTEITCFCNSKLFQFNNGQIQKICQTIFQKLYISNGLQILAALISTFTNFLFGIVIDKIINFTKPKNFSSGLVSKTFALFLFFMINTCLLPLLLYANVFGFKIASYVSLIQLLIPNEGSVWFNTSSLVYYSDFTTIWYQNVSPYFTNFLIINTAIIWVKFIYYSCSNKRRIANLEQLQGKILQKNMNKQIIDYSIDIVDQQASLFLIIFLSMIYCGGIPVLIPIATFNIGSRYISNKYFILNYSSRVYGLTQDFNSLSTNLLPFSIIFSGLFGIWMLTGSSYIFPNGQSVNIPGTSGWQNIFILFPRLFYLSYTLIMVLIVIGYLLLYNTLIRFFGWLSNLCYSSKEPEIKKEKSIKFSKAAQTLNVLSSYNIHSNDKYKNIIINLQRYLELQQQ